MRNDIHLSTNQPKKKERWNTNKQTNKANREEFAKQKSKIRKNIRKLSRKRYAAFVRDARRCASVRLRGERTLQLIFVYFCNEKRKKKHNTHRPRQQSKRPINEDGFVCVCVRVCVWRVQPYREPAAASEYIVSIRKIDLYVSRQTFHYYFFFYFFSSSAMLYMHFPEYFLFSSYSSFLLSE